VPLSTIIAIQFVPLFAIVAIIATFTWRRTGSSLPGALICGLLSPGMWWQAPPPRRRSRPKDGLKLHSALAFASASAVL